jgi:hypothetical protein
MLGTPQHTSAASWDSQRGARIGLVDRDEAGHERDELVRVQRVEHAVEQQLGSQQLVGGVDLARRAALERHQALLRHVAQPPQHGRPAARALLSGAPRRRRTRTPSFGTSTYQSVPAVEGLLTTMSQWKIAHPVAACASLRVARHHPGGQAQGRPRAGAAPALGLDAEVGQVRLAHARAQRVRPRRQRRLAAHGRSRARVAAALRL